MSAAVVRTHEVYRDGHVVGIDNERGAEISAAFQRASELPQGAPAPLAALPVTEAPELVVAPVVSLLNARQLWTAHQEFKAIILADPSCADEIAGIRERNRTGATRLAIAFGLSIEDRLVEDGRVELADSGEFDHRCVVRVRVSKRPRYVDGIGSCRISEIEEKTKRDEIAPTSQREHTALSRAWTRAAKRAIADILGGTDPERSPRSAPSATLPPSSG